MTPYQIHIKEKYSNINWKSTSNNNHIYASITHNLYGAYLVIGSIIDRIEYYANSGNHMIYINENDIQKFHKLEVKLKNFT